MTPFNLKLNHKGSYRFNLSSTMSIPTNLCVYIEDLNTSQLFDLRTAKTCSFSVNDTTLSIRFLLHITQPIRLSAIANTCSKSTNGKIILKSNITTNWTFVWKNAKGIIVKVNNTSKLCDTVKNLCAGMYYLKAISNTNCCASISDSIEVRTAGSLVVQATLFKKHDVHDNATLIKSTKGSHIKSTYAINWTESDDSVPVKNANPSAYAQILQDSKKCREAFTNLVVKPNTTLIKNYPTIFPDMYLMISLNPLNKIMIPESIYQLLMKAETLNAINKKRESEHNRIYAFHFKGQKEKHKANLSTPIVLRVN